MIIFSVYFWMWRTTAFSGFEVHPPINQRRYENPHSWIISYWNLSFINVGLPQGKRIKGADNPTCPLLPIITNGPERWWERVVSEKNVCATCVGTSRQMTPGVTKCHACHACHAKCHRMSPSATPATPNDTGCHQVPRQQHKQPRGTTASNGAQARHQSQPRAISATPATQSEGRCHQVPRLPHPIQNKLSCVCVWVSCVWESCAWKVVCVSKLCVIELCVGKLCMRELCVRELCVRELHVCERVVCVSKLCVWLIVCERAVCE